MSASTPWSPTVSVIVRTYNRERYISETLRSIYAQTYQDFEAILVDDGSTDNTRQVVDSFRAPRLRYHYQPNQGPAVALNEGIRLAKGRYIAILDSDDLWLPHLLETAVAHLESHPEAGVFYAQSTSIDEHGNPLGPIQGAALKYPGEPLKSLLYGDVVSPATAVIRRGCLDEVGEFDERLNGVEDWDMWLRIARHHPVVYHPDIVAR